jgi:hypothetical protein
MKTRTITTVKLDTGNVHIDFTFPKGATVVNIVKELVSFACDVDPDMLLSFNTVMHDINAVIAIKLKEKKG